MHKRLKSWALCTRLGWRSEADTLPRTGENGFGHQHRVLKKADVGCIQLGMEVVHEEHTVGQLVNELYLHGGMVVWLLGKGVGMHHHTGGQLVRVNEKMGTDKVRQIKGGKEQSDYFSVSCHVGVIVFFVDIVAVVYCVYSAPIAAKLRIKNELY